MSLRGLALLAFFVVSIPICFLRPFYGIALWIIVAFLNPQSYTWKALDAFPWAWAVAIPTILGMLVFDRKFERLVSITFALLSILWVWFTITTLVSTNNPEFAHHTGETWERWNFVSKVLLMTTCTIVIVSSFERLRYLMLTIAGCFGFYVLKSLPFTIVTGGAFRLHGPDYSMISDNNDFALALNMTLPVYFSLAHTEPNRWMRRFCAWMFIITIPAIFFTYSRGGLVGLGAVLFFMFLQSRRRLTLIPVFVLGALIAVFFAPDAWKERMDPSRPDAIDASAQSRLNAWAYARALAADYPVTGGGFATFTEELYGRYSPREAMIIYGPHSIYFQVLAEHGYVGLALYVLLAISCLVAARRLRRSAAACGDIEIEHYAHMLQLSLVGFIASGIFLGRAYFDYFFTIVACIIILERTAKDRGATEMNRSVLAPPPADAKLVQMPAAGSHL